MIALLTTGHRDAFPRERRTPVVVNGQSTDRKRLVVASERLVLVP
jgi:hypothetical protein